MLTKKHLAFFDENGYVVVNKIFTQKAINEMTIFLRSIVATLIRKAMRENPRLKNQLQKCFGSELKVGINTLDSVNHKYISEFNDSLSITNNLYVAKMLSSTKFINYINHLLRMPSDNPLFITNGGAVFGTPNDNKFTANKWHTDAFYTFKDGEYIQFWAPLIEDVTENLGAIHVMPGSHKNSFEGQQKNTSGKDSSVYRFTVSEKLLSKYDDKVLELKLGQGLFFDKHLVHRGGNNITNRTRFALLGIYHSMSNPKFTPYTLNHPKSLITADQYFDEVMVK